MTGKKYALDAPKQFNVGYRNALRMSTEPTAFAAFGGRKTHGSDSWS